MPRYISDGVNWKLVEENPVVQEKEEKSGKLEKKEIQNDKIDVKLEKETKVEEVKVSKKGRPAKVKKGE